MFNFSVRYIFEYKLNDTIFWKFNLRHRCELVGLGHRKRSHGRRHLCAGIPTAGSAISVSATDRLWRNSDARWHHRAGKMAARATPIIGAPLPHPQIYSAIRSVLARVSRKRASEVRKDVFKTYSNGPVALFTVGALVMKPAAANTDKDRTR